MRIVCAIHSLDGGGAERVMARLASMLAGRGHDVALLTLDNACKDRHEVATAVRRIPLDVIGNPQRGIAKLSSIKTRLLAIRSTLLRENPDVVLSFCDRNNIDVLLATTRLSIPVVISERSDPSAQKLSKNWVLGRFWECVRRRVYRRARRIIALTPEIAAALQPLSKRPIAVIPSAVDPVSNLRPLEERDRVILGVGRLESEKGFGRLVDAFAAVANDVPGWNLRILGDGSQRNVLQNKIDRLGLANRVELPGWIRPIAPEYGRASLFVLPSYYEGFPSALLEAMASGIPAIAMDCQSGSCQIIDHEVNGLLISGSSNEIAQAIRRLILDACLRERLAKEAIHVSELYSWERMTDAYESVMSL
ncbi:alpha-1,4-N-acetyl-D-galactosaminyltransferase [Novipirellula aureliae]|uniref:Alpha-1,4-N-acetyl-D-galactosaminyltransferase n=1 Tax=Novipirellula aureliae TaxID=2527966 RepID=A0A5C6E2D1_9BACT|nr:glycosyltransferase [Novipirellula aureliae]TWU41536.1 alpha-1,4-N-acetyl-D-galactosaminyltransferase [Novipirellula aureliae]